jgi:hypothetical protein
MKLGRGFQPVNPQSNLVKPQSNTQQGLFGLAKLPTLAAAPAGQFTQGLRLRVSGGTNAAAAAAAENIASVGSSIQEALSKLRIVPAFASSSSSNSDSQVDPSRFRTQSPGTDGSSTTTSSSSSVAPGSINDRNQALLRRSSSQQQQQQQQPQDSAAADATTTSSSSSTTADPVHAPSSSSSGSGQPLQNLPQVAMLAANERDATPQPGTSTAHDVQQVLNPVDLESLRSAVAAVTAARLEGRARVMARRSHSGKAMKQMRAASAAG